MDLWGQLILVAVCAAVAGGAAYLLATSRAARATTLAALGAAQEAVGEYLRTHPVTAADEAALLAAVYGRLPAAVRARVSLADFAAEVGPLLQLAETALQQPPPGGPG